MRIYYQYGYKHKTCGTLVFIIILADINIVLDSIYNIYSKLTCSCPVINLSDKDIFEIVSTESVLIYVVNDK